MNTFAFLLHPLDKHDVARKYGIARYVPEGWVEAAMRFMKPAVLAEVDLTSTTGAEARGLFVVCPATARQLLRDEPETSYAAILSAARFAAEKGAQLVGLGAYTSVAGDGGITVAERLDIGVTTGNSYTVATAVRGALEAARLVGHDPKTIAAAVLGATGSLGRACSLMLADEVARVILVGRRRERLEELVAEVRSWTETPVHPQTDIATALREADLVIAVTSAVDAVVPAEALRPGTVVCDVARPRDVSRKVAEQRGDVLVIEGGVVEVPGRPEWDFNFGFPDGLAYACMAETMVLTLEGRFGDYSLGRELELEKAREISELADKHGFKLAGFRSFEQVVSEETIESVRASGERARAAV